ncbi:DUF1642 domain-containing protein [Lactococcus petauri]|uniref:DUF1642 domain-containing protein n=1 Tax=Lactococcus petauri TaxID=1940789 RepID=UPI0013FDFD32|nr:DUF1642 domain-containing protein [Lactococcus petauri]NHI71366.1 DUF1642 domain-containing protein [Lactococcus petauri]
MKKFEEEINKKVGTFDVVGHHNGVCCLFEEVKAFGKDWVSPEDHQAEVNKLKNKINWLHNLLDGRNEEELQTVKQLNEAIPEIPESLAKIIETHDLSVLGDWEKVVNILSEEALTWLSQTDNVSALLGKAVTLCNLKIKGYTVAKEKRFYLKHELTGQFLAKRNQESGYRKYFFWTGENPLTHSIGTAWELKFTQREIDSMETGSYEQIEVDE